MSRAQEYRLRAFEAAYVQPNLDFFGERPGLVWEALSHTYGTSEGTLRLFLLREASNWIDMGRQCGYFSRDLEPLATDADGFNVSGATFDIGERGFSRRLPSLEEFVSKWDLNPDRLYLLWGVNWERFKESDLFDEALSSAVENLRSVDYLEFLRLLLFAEDGEWKERTDDLAQLQSALEGGVQPPFPQWLMDRIAWAFHGLNTELEIVGCPSDWRASPITELRYDRRVGELRRWRLKIVEHVGRLLINDVYGEDAIETEPARQRIMQDLLDAASEYGDGSPGSAAR